MSSLNDSSHRRASIQPTLVKRIARPAVLRLQRTFRLFPTELCIISGAPRSGTTALCEWLGDHRGILVFQETRILVSIHRFIEEIGRFRNLDRDGAVVYQLAHRLVHDYYSRSSIIIGKRLVVDKEPLEPIAFPAKDYERFIINVKELFPESKLILAIRDPIATIWSMSRRRWGDSLTHMESREFSIEEYVENWCACADLVLKYCSDPDTCIVQFGRLVNDPENESRRISNFLNIRKGNSFQPRQTKEIGFNDEERERILQMVQPRLKLLSAQGISDLS